MADQVAVVEFQTPSSSGTFDITSGSLTDTVMGAVVLFSAEPSANDDANQAHAITGISFVASDGVAEDEVTAGIATRSADALTSTQITRTAKFNGPTTKIVVGAPSDGSTSSTFQAQANFDSFIAGGLRLNAVTTTTQVSGSALMFAGVTRAYAGLFSSSTSGGHEDTGGGTQFQPDIVIFSISDGTFSGTGTFNVWGINSLGFAARSQAVVSSLLGWNNNADPSDADGAVRSALLQSMNTLGVFQDVTITIDSTGFNHISSVGTPDGCYLAIKFADSETRYGAFNFPVAASAGLQSFSCGFLPRAVLGMSQLITTEDSQTDGLGGFGRSMFTDSAARAYAASSQDGLTVSVGTPSVAKTLQSDAALLTLANDATLAQKATLSGFTGSGFTLNFSTASAAGLFTCLAIGVDFPPIVQNETVEVSEGLVMFGSRTVVFDETVEISEVFDSITNFVLTGRFTAGWTMTGGSKRGSTLTPGAEMGSLL